MGAAARLGTRISLRIASRIFATIMPYTIEAADKVADAIERGERRRPSPSRSQSLVGGAVGISSVGAQYVQTGNYTLLAGFNRGAGWRSTCPAAPLCRRLAELFESPARQPHPCAAAFIASERRAAPDLVGDLARQELAVTGSGEELAAGHCDLAAQDCHARPGRHFMALPWRVIGLVQILFADDPSSARVKQHDVGVGADRQCPFLRVKAHDPSGIRRDQIDEIGQAVATV